VWQTTYFVSMCDENIEEHARKLQKVGDILDRQLKDKEHSLGNVHLTARFHDVRQYARLCVDNLCLLQRCARAYHINLDYKVDPNVQADDYRLSEGVGLGEEDIKIIDEFTRESVELYKQIPVPALVKPVQKFANKYYRINKLQVVSRRRQFRGSNDQWRKKITKSLRSDDESIHYFHSASKRIFSNFRAMFPRLSCAFADHMNSFRQVKLEDADEGKFFTSTNVATCLPYDHAFGSERHESTIKELRDRQFFVHCEKVPGINTLFIVVADSVDFELSTFMQFLKSNTQFRKHRAYYLKGLFSDPSSDIVSS